MEFTTSWDDGCKQDLKLRELLDQYGIKGTFYVCPRRQHNQQLLSEEDTQEISKRHEIGAHTLRHSKLTNVSLIDAKTEIVESKKWVEQIIEKPCEMFCYPYGFVNDEVEQMVMNAGFKGARTTEPLQLDIQTAYKMPTTLQVSPFPRRKAWSRIWHPLDPFGPLRVKYRRLRKIGIKHVDMKNWLSLATALFDLANESQDSTFHLWGHSHEIEKYNMWSELEAFLKHVQESNVKCVTNSHTL